MAPLRLDTTSSVMDALGGNRAVSELTGRSATAVSNWRASENFPSNTYLCMTDALRASGFVAPASLWRMTEPACARCDTAEMSP